MFTICFMFCRPPSRDSIRPRSRTHPNDAAALLGVSDLTTSRPLTSAGRSRVVKASSADDVQHRVPSRAQSAPTRGRKMRSRSMDRPGYMQPTAAFRESRAQMALNGAWATTKSQKMNKRRAKKPQTSTDIIVNSEMTHFSRDIMNKLSQVVSTVSQDLEAVSGQLRTLTETMATSMNLSMSRDLSQIREEVVIGDSFLRQSPVKSPHKSPVKSAPEDADQLTHLIQNRLRKKLTGLLERE